MYLKSMFRPAALLLLIVTCTGCAETATARTEPAAESVASPGSQPSPPSAPRPRTLTRLIFEDHADQQLKWVDVLVDEERNVSLAAVRPVPGFPALDAARHKLVQMREADGLVMVGVRDDDDGNWKSGWVVVDAGVRHDDHGAHVHWNFRGAPAVKAQRIDQQQGNPAHLYEYDGRFYLANDRLNGYTRIDPAELRQASDAAGASRFVPGGGNHITLAVLEDRVGYSCWIDGGGPNCGRVDVTSLASPAPSSPTYSFALPSGGIHGAIGHSGRVFFAPSDGVCWVDADLHAAGKAEDVTVHHLSLGTQDDQPRRTGAFVNAGRYVLCVAGKEADAGLVWIDATAPAPTVQRLPLQAKAGDHVTTPCIVTRRDGAPFALLFHDHEAEAETQDRLTIVELDPDRDGVFDDAQILKSLDVGRSAVEGHYGHHALACDADLRYAFVTNPGDGTVSVLSIGSLDWVATLPLGGKPTALVAVGGREVRD